MTTQLSLNEVELEMILGLVKAHQRELPTEIHHSVTFEGRHDLREQAKVVAQLVERLEQALAKCGGPKPSAAEPQLS